MNFFPCKVPPRSGKVAIVKGQQSDRLNELFCNLERCYVSFGRIKIV
jgi:hypothetical protein